MITGVGTITEIVDVIRKISCLSEDSEVYIVGGFLRDVLLKRGSKYSDIDLVVNKNALKYSKKIASAFKSKLITLNDANKTYRIILKSSVIENIDISLLNGKTIERDLQNRDFTVNAVAFNLKDFKDFKDFKKQIIFLKNSNVRDLKSRIINTVSVRSFEIDPLRMLRAFRFAVELNFDISQGTFKQIRRNAKLIRKVAPERIKNEFFRILSVKNSVSLLKEMDKCKLISEIFYEIDTMKKASKKYYYHPGGLFQHSFETMRFTEKILNNLKEYFPNNYIDLHKHFDDNNIFSENVTRESLLKFAAFFHDNAKPETSKFINGKMHFFGHEKLGADKIKKIMISLKSSKKDIETVSFLIRHHMRPSTLTKNNVITKKAALKFFRDIGDNTPDALILSMSDWYSYKKLGTFSPIALKLQKKFIRGLIKYYYELKKAKPLSKIVDGNVIMKKFNLRPGPWIGELLDFVFEAQQEGKISKPCEALKLISLKLTCVKKKYKISVSKI
ncbi:MAG: HD domain-containing protein [Endomicrobium sp.]|jgi:poly(A) polymerase|nr:HD domain-containing protein [Endomicrobium sp.]